MSAEQPFSPDPYPTTTAYPAPAGIPQQRPASEPTTANQDGTKAVSITGAAMSAGGGVLVTLGSFMPWATITAPLIGTVTRSGMDGNSDGHYTIWFGLLILGLGAARFARDHLALRIPIVVLAVLAFLFGAIDLAAVNEKMSGLSNAYAWASTGPGLYVIVLGGVVAAVGAFVRRGKAA